MHSVWRHLYPFQSRYVGVAGHRVHYLDEGEPPSADCGETLLLVHGNPTWSFHWRQLILAWRPSFRVIAVDHLGCGLSDKPRRPAVRLANRIDELVEFVERLDLRHVTLVGHDWGGAIGLGAALECPSRFCRFVLLNTGAFPPRRVPWRLAILRTPLLGQLAIQGLNLFLRAALRMTMFEPRRLTPAVRAGYLTPYQGWHNRRAIYQFVADIPLTTWHPTYQTLARIENQLGQLSDRPMLLLWGMRDWCFRADCLERFTEIFPQASVHRFQQAGHWIAEDEPQGVATLVEQFVRQRSSSATLPGSSRHVDHDPLPRR